MFPLPVLLLPISLIFLVADTEWLTTHVPFDRVVTATCKLPLYRPLCPSLCWFSASESICPSICPSVLEYRPISAFGAGTQIIAHKISHASQSIDPTLFETPELFMTFRDYLYSQNFKYQRFIISEESRLDPTMLAEIVTNLEDSLAVSKYITLELHRAFRSLHNTMTALSTTHKGTTYAVERVLHSPPQGLVTSYLPKSWRPQTRVVHLDGQIRHHVDATYSSLQNLTQWFTSKKTKLERILKLYVEILRLQKHSLATVIAKEQRLWPVKVPLSRLLRMVPQGGDPDGIETLRSDHETLKNMKTTVTMLLDALTPVLSDCTDALDVASNLQSLSSSRDDYFEWRMAPVMSFPISCILTSPSPHPFTSLPSPC